jgi:hypothetical protein
MADKPREACAEWDIYALCPGKNGICPGRFVGATSKAESIPPRGGVEGQNWRYDAYCSLLRLMLASICGCGSRVRSLPCSTARAKCVIKNRLHDAAGAWLRLTPQVCRGYPFAKRSRVAQLWSIQNVRSGGEPFAAGFFLPFNTRRQTLWAPFLNGHLQHFRRGSFFCACIPPLSRTLYLYQRIED